MFLRSIESYFGVYFRSCEAMSTEIVHHKHYSLYYCNYHYHRYLSFLSISSLSLCYRYHYYHSIIAIIILLLLSLSLPLSLSLSFLFFLFLLLYCHCHCNCHCHYHYYNHYHHYHCYHHRYYFISEPKCIYFIQKYFMNIMYVVNTYFDLYGVICLVVIFDNCYALSEKIWQI